jgi:hypothetical protein
MMLSKEYVSTAQTLLRVARNMTDQAIANRLKALADDYERRARKAADAEAAKRLASARVRLEAEEATSGKHDLAKRIAMPSLACRSPFVIEKSNRRSSYVAAVLGFRCALSFDGQSRCCGCIRDVACVGPRSGRTLRDVPAARLVRASGERKRSVLLFLQTVT